MRAGTKAARSITGLLGLALVGMAACATTRGAAPLLTPVIVERGEELGFAATDLARGRDLFAGRCARCHVLPAVDGETASSWNEILPRMSRKSGLDPVEAAAVRAFVLSARSSGG